jgi:predicted GNAT superfamily acetyltransferase
VLEIRELESLEEFQECVQIQKEVWGFDDPYDIVPLPLLVISKRIDGIILGAFEKNRLIGFVYSLPGTHKGLQLQWSHMLAVRPEYRDSDIGYQLKMAQYKESADKSYDLIEWTYDPLESKNAHFNLRKLGCIALEYEVNVYGETSSPLHHGMPTDRLIAHWPIPPYTKTRQDWTELPQPPALITRTKKVEEDLIIIEDARLDASDEFLFVEIPTQIQKVKSKSSQAALDWRLKTREIFLGYLHRNYIVYSFLYYRQIQPARSFYVLKRV